LTEKRPGKSKVREGRICGGPDYAMLGEVLGREKVACQEGCLHATLGLSVRRVLKGEIGGHSLAGLDKPAHHKKNHLGFTHSYRKIVGKDTVGKPLGCDRHRGDEEAAN